MINNNWYDWMLSKVVQFHFGHNEASQQVSCSTIYIWMQSTHVGLQSYRNGIFFKVFISMQSWTKLVISFALKKVLDKKISVFDNSRFPTFIHAISLVFFCEKDKNENFQYFLQVGADERVQKTSRLSPRCAKNVLCARMDFVCVAMIAERSIYICKKPKRQSYLRRVRIQILSKC